MPFVIFPALLVLGVVFYLFSVRSRKNYRCSQCGETIKNVEYLKAKHCGMCGSPFETTKENQ